MFSKTTIAICLNLLQVCPSVSLFVCTFNVLSGFLCLTQFGSNYNRLNLINNCNTAPLTDGTLKSLA